MCTASIKRRKKQITDNKHLLTLFSAEPVSNVTVKANATALVEFNDTAVFMCSVSSGSSLSFAWLQGHDELTDGGRVELSNGNATLTVRSVTRDDEGPFKCSVSNGVSHEMSAPLYLNISCECHLTCIFQ